MGHDRDALGLAIKASEKSQPCTHTSVGTDYLPAKPAPAHLLPLIFCCLPHITPKSLTQGNTWGWWSTNTLPSCSLPPGSVQKRSNLCRKSLKFSIEKLLIPPKVFFFTSWHFPATPSPPPPPPHFVFPTRTNAKPLLLQYHRFQKCVSALLDGLIFAN